jgi:DNA-binding Lrp family transcriptional regulator
METKKWNAWVWIKWKAGTPTTAWEGWQGNKQIARAWSTQGDWDCCLHVDVTSHDQLEEFVWKHVRNNEWVESTRTMWAKTWW